MKKSFCHPYLLIIATVIVKKIETKDLKCYKHSTANIMTSRHRRCGINVADCVLALTLT